jgi:hypothetical protein
LGSPQIKEKNKKNKRQQKNRKIRMKNNGNLVKAGREGMQIHGGTKLRF